MSAADPEQEIENAMHVDTEAWSRDTLLEYLADQYDSPAHAHGMDQHELISWVSDWANLLDAEKAQEDFKEMLEEYDEEYDSTWLEDSNSGECMFYGHINDPSDEGYLMIESDGSEDYLEILGR